MSQGFVNPTSGNTGGYNQISVTSTATLSASAFGNQVLCTGSSAYAVTLPSASSNAGKFIDFQVLTTSNALITLTPASGTIQLQSTFILGSGESCRLYCDGTNWWAENVYLTPVNFMATCTSTTSIGSLTQVPYNNILYDIGSFFDNVTNFRYQPKYPGKYMVTGTAAFSATGVGAEQVGEILLTGSEYAAFEMQLPYSGGLVNVPCSAIVPMNGSTDYIEFWVGTNGSGASLSGTARANYFTAARISNF